MFFIKQGKTNLIYILIVVILVLAIAESTNAVKAPEARVTSDMALLQTVAELIYTDENSYINVNCNYGDIKILCDDMELFSGMKPIIHTSADEYCAYVKLSKEKEFRGEYYGNYWCIDSKGISRQIQYLDPGSSGYCSGSTFRCPDRNGGPSFNQTLGSAIDKFFRLLPTILGWVGLISGCAILFWNYLRRKKGKKRLPFLWAIGVTLLVASILWFLIVVSLSGAR